MILRKLAEKDADGMLEWMKDEDIQKNFRFKASDKTRADVLEFIHNAETNPIDGKSIHYAIADENDEYLGTISLKDINLSAKKAEYAISLRKKSQGHGIGTEATKEILRKAFFEFGLERVDLNVLSDNIKAIHVYEKYGFVNDKELETYLSLHGKYCGLKWYHILRKEYIEKFVCEK